ncbi:hypothetical protein AMTR_s00008p00266740 [Amborella trichopoda]|uniref:Uncharacterized protein n=1 Tax=Amborella trichopoda TaxID=13333 RepID=W1NI61_AMBTC|nr:hypothetical protein AMTR_s00008p00266740 [Amborella trichopoda]
MEVSAVDLAIVQAVLQAIGNPSLGHIANLSPQPNLVAPQFGRVPPDSGMRRNHPTFDPSYPFYHQQQPPYHPQPREVLPTPVALTYQLVYQSTPVYLATQPMTLGSNP